MPSVVHQDCGEVCLPPEVELRPCEWKDPENKDEGVYPRRCGKFLPCAVCGKNLYDLPVTDPDVLEAVEVCYSGHVMCISCSPDFKGLAEHHWKKHQQKMVTDKIPAPNRERYHDRALRDYHGEMRGAWCPVKGCVDVMVFSTDPTEDLEDEKERLFNQWVAEHILTEHYVMWDGSEWDQTTISDGTFSGTFRRSSVLKQLVTRLVVKRVPNTGGGKRTRTGGGNKHGVVLAQLPMQTGSFKEFSILSTVVIDDMLLDTIQDEAFMYCGRLKTMGDTEGVVKLPEGITSIGTDAFSFCTSMESVVIPDSVGIIQNSAFEACTALKRVVLGQGVKRISLHAFRDCSSLEEVIYPPHDLEVNPAAFTGCDRLKTFYFGGGTIVAKVTAMANPNIETAIVGESVREIKFPAFNNYRFLKEVTILGRGLKFIGAETFDGTALSDITLPRSVSSIGHHAFPVGTRVRLGGK